MKFNRPSCIWLVVLFLGIVVLGIAKSRPAYERPTAAATMPNHSVAVSQPVDLYREDFRAGTSYEGMTPALEKLVSDSNGAIQLSSVGKSSSGRELWKIFIPSTGGGVPRSAYVICRQHGDEPAVTGFVMGFLRMINANDSSLTAMRRNYNLTIFPMANPDGATHLTRYISGSEDMNRDWGRFAYPETTQIAKDIRRSSAVDNAPVLLDFHELSPGEMVPPYIEVAGPGYGLDPDVRKQNAQLIAAVAARLRKVGFGIKPVPQPRVRTANLAVLYWPRPAEIDGTSYPGCATILLESPQSRPGGGKFSIRERMGRHTQALIAALSAPVYWDFPMPTS